MNSYAELIEAHCPTCQRAFQGKLWLIVDTVERLDLVKPIQRGKLHRLVCPDCGQMAAEPDKPLLLYRPDAEPVLLFSPSQGTSREEDEADWARLIAQLKQSLGDQWQDGWLESGLRAILRPVLPQVLEGNLGFNLEEVFQQMQAQLQQMAEQPEGIPTWAELQDVLINRFVRAQTWTDSQQVVVQHPELLTEQADWVLARLIEAQDREEARQVLQEHRELLQRCRQVGIEQAFQEKDGGSSTTRMQVLDELMPLLQHLLQLNRPSDHPQRIQILQVLTQVTKTHNPQLWAALQGELGDSYAQSLQGNRSQNIEDAIAAYQQTLTVMTQAAMPVEWATTLNNLANAYYSRIQGDKAQNIEDAIAAYQQTLTVMTQANLPLEWAQIMMNLGIAYYFRIQGDKAQNIEDAIAAYQQSLTVRKQANLPVEWAQTMMNLGIAYSERIWGNKAQNIEDAIAAYQQSLTVMTQAAIPIEWAQTMNNLANAYRERIGGDKAQNIEDAIAVYQQSLTVTTQANLPIEWAATLNNLGIAYYSRIRGDKAQNIEDAIAAYQQSLTVLTPTTNPYNCIIAARGLGDLHFTQGGWQAALDEGYKIAIQSVEQTRTWSSSDERRQEVLANAIGVYDNALQCYVNLNQYQEAILLTERARSRHLVDLMHSNDLYQGGEIPIEIQQYLDKYERLQQQIDQLRQQQRRDDSALSGTHLRFTLRDQETVKVTVETLLQQKAAVWGKLRAKDRVLAEQLEVPHLDFEQLAKLIKDQPTTAILSFYSTNDHTYIFVVRHSETGITCDVQTCEKQSKQELQLWIAQNWLTPYKIDFDTWIEQMPQQLGNLAQRLQLDQLITEYLQGIEELILIPHIFLHLIPFAALPLTPNSSLSGRGEPEKPEYLGDRFRLRVVPSAQILKYCHDRENSGLAPDVPGEGFGSVEDATGDRPIVASGFEPVAQLLGIPANQRLRGPEQATLSNYRQLTQTPHIRALHSIHHAGSDLENPLESALLLANHDRLTLGQLMSPGWRMPHLVEVFLSCCETNLGRPNVTDDIVTLSTGFLCAGARVVISTLWSVDALATALFCLLYYQFREQGSDRPTALQQAQQAMRQPGRKLGKVIDGYFQQAIAQTKQADLRDTLIQMQAEFRSRIRQQPSAPLFDSPFYWAGFVCQGLS